jgi:hypothetical protein
MSEQTTVLKKATFGLFAELKQSEEIFLSVLKEQKKIDYENIVERMEALKQKFLKEYPWASEENYFVLPNNAFKQLLISINNPHKYKLFELYKGNWKESPETKDSHYLDGLSKDKPFVLRKVMICNDFLGELKEREFIGRDTCVPVVITDFSILQKIVYEHSNGEILQSFEKDLRGMDEIQFLDFIPESAHSSN